VCRIRSTTSSGIVSWATTRMSAGTSGPVRGPGAGTAWAGSATTVVGDAAGADAGAEAVDAVAVVDAVGLGLVVGSSLDRASVLWQAASALIAASAAASRTP